MTAPGIRRALARIAAGSPARVFVLRGADPPADPDDLALCDDVVLVESPRHAMVLLVAGRVPDVLASAARQVHDALPPPRRTIMWVRESALEANPARAGVDRFDVPAARTLVTPGGTSDDEALAAVAGALVAAQCELLSAPESSEGDLLADTDPAPWRGVGPYGQGGLGMTGGVPYGRPMATRAPDRDALELDQLPLRTGPWLAPFPAGLVLDLGLQGDVVQKCAVAAAPRSPLSAELARALREAMPIRVVEMARARSHLGWLARTLFAHGLPALGRRALAIASDTRTDGGDTPRRCAAALRQLDHAVRRSGVLAIALTGIGVLPADRLDGLGPLERAAGHAGDARTDEPAYRSLGFTPIVQSDAGAGDAAARWRQRIAEAAQSFALAQSAGETRAWGSGRVEGPRGVVTVDGVAPESRAAALVPGAIEGCEWGDAVSIIASLDLGPGGVVDSLAAWTAPADMLAAQSGGMSGKSGKSGMSGMSDSMSHG